jgi:chromosome segregation ATPase
MTEFMVILIVALAIGFLAVGFPLAGAQIGKVRYRKRASLADKERDEARKERDEMAKRKKFAEREKVDAEDRVKVAEIKTETAERSRQAAETRVRQLEERLETLRVQAVSLTEECDAAKAEAAENAKRLRELEKDNGHLTEVNRSQRDRISVLEDHAGTVVEASRRLEALLGSKRTP